MRRQFATFAVMLAASFAATGRAEPPVLPAYIHLGTLTTGTQTVANVVGHVEEITASVNGGTVTGNVFVSYAPANGVSAAVNLATNAVIGSKTWRPAVDATDVLGADLTSDPPRRHYLYGETVTVIVTGSPTGKTWRVDVKLDK
jgi:hypothetical protein